MTPQEGVQDVIRKLREAADQISRGEHIAVLFASDYGGPAGQGTVIVFAPPQVAADLTLRLLGASLNIAARTQQEVAEGLVVRNHKATN